MTLDNIQYPKDTPEWLKELFNETQKTIERDIELTSADNFLEIRGKVKLFKRIKEEIDALGQIELSNERNIQIAATRR